MTATGKDDPESTPLPAPLPGLGVAGPDSDVGAELAPHGHAISAEPPARAAAPAPAPVRAPAAAPVAARVPVPAEPSAAPPKPAKDARDAKDAATGRPSAHDPGKAAAAGKAGNSKMWVVIAGLGVVAVGVIAAVVLLPGPSSRTTGPGGAERPAARTGGPAGGPAVGTMPSVEPPVPASVPVTPVPGEANKPAKGEQGSAKSQPPTTPPATASQTEKPDEPDEGDEPDSTGNTTSKPSRAERREHAKAARAAAKAAKAAKAAAAEPETPPAPVKSLSQEILRQNMLRAESHFKSCAKEAWGSFVTISIVVDNSGSVQKADLIGPLGSTATGRCISDQIRKQHFPPFTEGASKQFVWSYQIPAAN